MDIFDIAIARKLGGGGGSTGGGGGTATVVPRNDVTFIDYDGTVLYSYTLAEAKKMTELPPLPSREGLVCQGWNYDLETIKSYDRPVDIGATYITDDGKTRIYIHLEEGRTSPMLGVGVNGTVTVDWGDGTEPDVLTGTSVISVKWTPNHEYEKAGEHVITLDVNGSAGLNGSGSNSRGSCILSYSSGADSRNRIYQSSIVGIEIGSGVTNIGNYAFDKCNKLSKIVIPNSVTTIGISIWTSCYKLTNVVIPNSVTTIGSSTFQSCFNLRSVVIPNSVTTIKYSTFSSCSSLTNAVIPNSVTTIERGTFQSCLTLTKIVIPNSVTTIESDAFNNCSGVKCIDFTACTSVPTLSNVDAFEGISPDCEFLIPSSLYDEWIIATNWATYADKIVAKG